LKPIVVSFSELDAIRQCDHKAELAYRQRWSPLVVGQALNRGRIWHLIMAWHYATIKADTTVHERARGVSRLLDEAEEEDAELMAWMYNGYVERYGSDPDWEILEIEDQSLLRLPDRSGRASRFYLRMRIDLLVRTKTIPRKIWLVDHKTGKDLPHSKALDLDDQFGLYTWGKRQQGVDVFGSIFNAVRTYRHKTGDRPLEERFARPRLYRAEPELETIAREAWTTARAFYQYKIGEAPRAPDSDRCTWRCPFTEPCLLGRKAGSGAELAFLRSGGFVQLTEDEQLAERGYVDPMMP
jgi:hypothetical protein